MTNVLARWGLTRDSALLLWGKIVGISGLIVTGVIDPKRLGLSDGQAHVVMVIAGAIAWLSGQLSSSSLPGKADAQRVSNATRIGVGVVVLALLLPAAARAKDCTDSGADHGREPVKNRKAPESIADAHLVTVGDVAAWPVPYVVMKTLGANEDKLLAGEEQLLHVIGYVQVYRCESDGDYHVEWSDTPSKTAPRIIAEAPPTHPDVRAAMEKILGGPPTSTVDVDPPVKVEIWGWRFLDLDHQLAAKNKKTGKPYTAAQRRRGHAHGSARVASLWEAAHPIIKIQEAP